MMPGGPPAFPLTLFLSWTTPFIQNSQEAGKGVALSFACFPRL